MPEPESDVDAHVDRVRELARMATRRGARLALESSNRVLADMCPGTPARRSVVATRPANGVIGNPFPGRLIMTTPDPDPMFDGIVRGANTYAQHQQDIAHLAAGIDPDTGKRLGDTDDVTDEQ